MKRSLFKEPTVIIKPKRKRNRLKSFEIRFKHPICQYTDTIVNVYNASTQEKAIKYWLNDWPGLMACDIITISEKPYVEPLSAKILRENIYVPKSYPEPHFGSC